MILPVAFAVPGGADPALLATPGVVLPPFVVPATLLAVTLTISAQGPSCTYTLDIRDGGGNIILHSVVAGQGAAPEVLTWAPDMVPGAQSSSYHSGGASIPSLVIDPSWTVRVLCEGSGIVSVAGCVFILEPLEEIAPRPPPPRPPRPRKSFPAALLSTVASYGRSPGQAIDILDGPA